MLSAVSGVLLAPLAYMLAASGLCVLHPELARVLTLGAIDSPALCLKLHTSPLLQATTAVVGAVHAYTTAELLATRMAGGPRAATVLHTVYRVAVLVFASLVATVAVLHYAY